MAWPIGGCNFTYISDLTVKLSLWVVSDNALLILYMCLPLKLRVSSLSLTCTFLINKVCLIGIQPGMFEITLRHASSETNILGGFK